MVLNLKFDKDPITELDKDRMTEFKITVRNGDDSKTIIYRSDNG